MATGDVHVVTGAFGFTGHAITRRLLDAGVRVRTLVRNPNRPNPFGAQVDVGPYRFDNLAALVRSLQGAAVLYNTYWIRFAHGRMTFDQAVANTRMLIQACVAAGVPRIVHLSVANASEDSPFPYYRGKGAVERAVKESTLSYAILKPALIFGPGDVLVNNIAWFLRHAPVFAIMGAGGYRLQCVHVDDLAEVAVHVAGRSENATMDVVGPETFTFDGFVRLIADRVRSHARIVHLPAEIVWGLLAIAGLVVRDIVLTRHEIAALMSNLLVTRSAPVGRTRFADWLDEHAPDLGRTYASELARHYR
jgi:uncharacterized protein YbjT (DUF2867 family)